MAWVATVSQILAWFTQAAMAVLPHAQIKSGLHFIAGR
jgi:hypothetical protein